MPTNLHKKLFQSEGTDKLLRPDIIPWDHYAAPEACSVVQSRQVFASDLAKGSMVSIEGLRYLPSQLMVFVNGVKLSPGVGYEEGIADSDTGYCDYITLNVGAIAGDALKCVAHNGVKYYSVPLKYTVAPTSTSKLSYCPVSASMFSNAWVKIDWGDGNVETLWPGNATVPPTHAYPTDDGTEYNVIVYADEGAWAGMTELFFGTNSEEGRTEHVIDLVSMDSDLPALGFTNRTSMFSGCSSLRSIPSTLFQNQITEAASFDECFNGCSSLVVIPSGLFDNCDSAVSYRHCFDGCSSVASLPSTLFSESPNAEDFTACFKDCSSLTVVPDKFFADCPNANTLSWCFSGSGITSLSTNTLSGCSSVVDLSYCFYGCDKLSSLSSATLNSCTSVEDLSYCFGGTTSLSYIPSSLFAKCTKVTNLSGCFEYGYTNLQFDIDLINLQDVAAADHFAYMQESDPYISSKLATVQCSSTTASTFGSGSMTELGCYVTCDYAIGTSYTYSTSRWVLQGTSSIGYAGWLEINASGIFETTLTYEITSVTKMADISYTYTDSAGRVWLVTPGSSYGTRSVATGTDDDGNTTYTTYTLYYAVVTRIS